MRDAIVYGYDWASAGPMERLALTVARAGGRVLHCDAVRSVLKRPDTSLREIELNLFTFTPVILTSRLNRYPKMPQLQGAAVARQILEHARTLGLKNPVFFYGCPGKLFPSLCQAMKAHGCLLVHMYTDSFESVEEKYIDPSDRTVVFSRTAFHRVRARWDEKIFHGFYGIDLGPFRDLRSCPELPPPLLEAVPRPRLGYTGSFAGEFLNTRVLRELFERRRQWHLVSFQWRPEQYGLTPALPLPNAHVLPWQGPEGLARCVAAFDIGLMAYDCSNVVLLNTAPMKLWDYFALGVPVVATPLIDLWEYEGLVYFGETAKELERAVEAALAEPKDSPLREKRKQEAEKHSMEAFGRALEAILG
ncbi:MAG TPA: hypothetical protein VNJ52_07890 [Patescibacteria group bacterium]|nr:hypothetical protein [Patescibacteria group bacterium]